VTSLAVGYLPGHISGVACWCRPRPVEEDGERVWYHRHVVLLPDREPRAFQSVLAGPPV
jgi:hypothetical protein